MTLEAERLHDELRKFGLTKYEAIIYTTLLMRGPSTASDIIEAAGIPQPRIYDVMSSLERRGLIESHSGRPKRYWPVDPNVALAKLFGEFESSYKLLSKSLGEMYRRSAEFKERPSVWILRGRDNIISRIGGVVKDAEVEVLVALPDFLVDRLGPMFAEKSSQGISITLVIHPFEKKVENFKQIAEQVSLRMREIAGMSMVIADNKRSVVCSSKMLARDWPSENCYGIFIEGNEELTQVLNDFFFFTLWQPAKPANSIPVRKIASFVNVSTAVEYLSVLQGLGKKAKVTVTGKRLRTGEPVRVSGYPEATVVERGGFRSMQLRTDRGELVNVGSLGAMLEDVEAEKIVITMA